jgi:hypothetical protein
MSPKHSSSPFNLPPYQVMSNTTSSAPTNWFSQFLDFTYDPMVGLKPNFNRLSAQRNWGPKLKNKRWAQCQEAQFGYAYGTDTTKLELWQDLCRDVYIKNPPSSITQCKKVCLIDEVRAIWDGQILMCWCRSSEAARCW